MTEPDELLVATQLRGISRADVVAKAVVTAFGKKLVTNNLRSLLVEAIVDEALSADWKRVSADWAGWDFQNGDLKLEVKQSAVKQTWRRKSASPPSKCQFDIAVRAGYYVGDEWFGFLKPARCAHIYIFAHHPVADCSADHGDPHQWRFYIVPTKALPDGKTIALSSVQALTAAVSFEALAEKVEEAKAVV